MHAPDVLALIDEVRALARSGLHYTDNPFEVERCERLLELASREYARVLTMDAGLVRDRFMAETGYATAKVGTDAGVFDDDGRVLLVRRADDGLWGLVAGWVDPSEPPEVTVVRELAEELGVPGRVETLVGTVFRPANAGYGPHSCVSLVYLCTIEHHHFTLPPHEVLEAAWHDIDAVDGWHLNHEQLARFAHEGWLRHRGGL